jgi:hypothetical protein
MAQAAGIIAAVAAVAGTAVAAVSAVRSGEAQQQAEDYNAAVQKQEAETAQQASETQAQITAQQTRQKLGEAASMYGASGVDVTTGSPLAVLSGMAQTGELNRQMNLWQGKTQATAFGNQAGLSLVSGTNAAAAGSIQAGTNLLTGSSNALLNLSKGLSTSSPATNPAGGAPGAPY